MSDQGGVFNASDLRNGGAIFRHLNPPALLAVLGDPVRHSISPQMHNAALHEGNHCCQYVHIHVAPAELSDVFSNLAPSGFLGANVTIPHKQSALHLVDEIGGEARLIGAINTVAVRHGKLHGFNTDGPGFSAAIREEFGVGLSELRVLILGGAGGAGRGIACQCALEGCPEILVANRKSEKGNALVRKIQDHLGASILPIPLDPGELSKALASVDLVVNATPLGMNETDPSPLPEGLLTDRHFVYDSVYSGGKSALVRQAERAGAKSANGLSMLLHQGALAYEIWFDESAPLETMRSAMKKATGLEMT